MAGAAGHVSGHKHRQMVSGGSRRSLAAKIMTDLLLLQNFRRIDIFQPSVFFFYTHKEREGFKYFITKDTNKTHTKKLKSKQSVGKNAFYSIKQQINANKCVMMMYNLLWYFKEDRHSF